MIWELPTICSSIYSAAQRSCENIVAPMVTVVQLVEHQVVILGVAGSSPVSHPKCPSLVLGPFQFSACMLAGLRG